MSLSPSPSMSSARRLAKCQIACLRWAGQERPATQRTAVSPSARTAGAPHTGHSRGSSKRTVSGGRRSDSTRTTSGMTSPARRTITVSRTRTSLRSSSSWLWSVALVTVTPRDPYRLQACDRGQSPGAPDLHLDVAHHGQLLLGRVLAGHRPARRPRHRAEGALLVEAVHLHHDAIDVEVERVTPPADRLVEGEATLDTAHHRELARHREAPLAQTAPSSPGGLRSRRDPRCVRDRGTALSTGATR